MSYDYAGKDQNLCEQGHRFDTDCYASGPKCPACGGPSVWRNRIDETNGWEYGAIPDEVWEDKFLVRAAQQKMCDLGHLHTLEPATYRKPTEDEQEAERRMLTEDGNDYVRIAEQNLWSQRWRRSSNLPKGT